MNLIMRLDRMLKGWPDTALTWLLLILAAVALYVAFFGNAALKVAVAAWMLFP